LLNKLNSTSIDNFYSVIVLFIDTMGMCVNDRIRWMLTRIAMIVLTLTRVRRRVRMNHRKHLRKRSAYTLFCLLNSDFNFSLVFFVDKNSYSCWSRSRTWRWLMLSNLGKKLWAIDSCCFFFPYAEDNYFIQEEQFLELYKFL